MVYKIVIIMIYIAKTFSKHVYMRWHYPNMYIVNTPTCIACTITPVNFRFSGSCYII